MTTEMHSVLEIIRRTTGFLEKRGVESARLDAELLIGAALGLPRMQLYLQFERPLTEPELEKIRLLVRRRGEREPLQYIVGVTEFFGIRLKVDRRALIPRPETEGLVELAIRSRSGPPDSVLDLGTGSGAIALALAKAWPQAAVTAVDQSPEALALAGENATAAGVSDQVRFVLSDWFAGLAAAQAFQLIVANPPYLSAGEVAAAQPEVKDHEPPGALASGNNGTAALEHIIREARSRLAPGGLLACETGITQHPALVALAKDLGYARVESRRDLTGRDRYLLAFV